MHARRHAEREAGGERAFEQRDRRQRGVQVERTQQLDAFAFAPAAEQVMRAAQARRRRVRASMIGEARVQRRAPLGRERVVQHRQEAALREAIALGVRDQDARRDQLVERGEHAPLVAVLGQRRVVAERERIAVGEHSTSPSSRASAASAVTRAASDADSVLGRSPSGELARQRPAAGFVAREAAIDQVLRELHRRARVALRQARGCARPRAAGCRRRRTPSASALRSRSALNSSSSIDSATERNRRSRTPTPRLSRHDR